MKKEYENITSHAEACKVLGMEEPPALPADAPDQAKKLFAIKQILDISDAINKVTNFEPNPKDLDRYKYFPRFKYNDGVLCFLAAGYDNTGENAHFGKSFTDGAVAAYVGKTFIDLYNEALK